jgi:hypothetical protein
VLADDICLSRARDEREPAQVRSSGAVLTGHAERSGAQGFARFEQKADAGYRLLLDPLGLDSVTPAFLFAGMGISFVVAY